MSKIPLTTIYGWSADAWHFTLSRSRLVAKIKRKRHLKILEIGASQNSACSIYFDNTISDITIGYKSFKAPSGLNIKLRNLKTEFGLESKYQLKKIDIFSVPGKWDIIIMKSVLGGIIKSYDDNSNLKKLIQQLCVDNLNDDGSLITIDNGHSYLEPFLKFSRARKKGWRVFKLGEIPFVSEQIGFGVLCSFALSSRFGRIGSKIEKIFFSIDLILSKLFYKRPAVICSIIKKKSLLK